MNIYNYKALIFNNSNDSFFACLNSSFFSSRAIESQFDSFLLVFLSSKSKIQHLKTTFRYCYKSQRKEGVELHRTLIEIQKKKIQFPFSFLIEL